MMKQLFCAVALAAVAGGVMASEATSLPPESELQLLNCQQMKQERVDGKLFLIGHNCLGTNAVVMARDLTKFKFKDGARAYQGSKYFLRIGASPADVESSEAERETSFNQLLSAGFMYFDEGESLDLVRDIVFREAEKGNLPVTVRAIKLDEKNGTLYGAVVSLEEVK